MRIHLKMRLGAVGLVGGPPAEGVMKQLNVAWRTCFDLSQAVCSMLLKLNR